MSRDTKIYFSLAAIVILIIMSIFLMKNSKNPKFFNEEIMKCIASKAEMYSQIGCSHCIAQKEILGNYTSLFNIIECNEDNENIKKCKEKGITGTPTWIINGKSYTGYKTIEELKGLTGC